jgi:hypothetical protein
MALLQALQDLIRPQIEQMSRVPDNTVASVQVPTPTPVQTFIPDMTPQQSTSDYQPQVPRVAGFADIPAGGGRFVTEEDAKVWNSQTGTFEPKPEEPWYKRAMNDPALMARLALGFNTMRLNPDQQLAAVLGDRIKTASQIGRQNKTAERVAVELQNQGRFKEAAMVEANPEIAKDMLAALMKPTKSFLTVTGAQANKMLGSDVFKPDQILSFDSETRKFSEIGGGGTNITNVLPSDQRESETQKGWGKELIERTKSYQVAGRNSNNLLQGVRNLQATLEGIDQGPLEEREYELRKFAASIGFPVDRVKLTQGEKATAVGGAMVVEQLRMNKGPQTDFDAQFQAKLLPGLGKTAQANQDLVDYMTSIHLLNTIYGREAGKAQGLEYKEGNAILNPLDELSTTVPAVAKIEGKWVQFSKYYEKSKSLNPQADGLEIVKNWKRAVVQ